MQAKVLFGSKNQHFLVEEGVDVYYRTKQVQSVLRVLVTIEPQVYLKWLLPGGMQDDIFKWPKRVLPLLSLCVFEYAVL